MVNGDGLPVKPYDEDGGMLQFALVDDDSNNQVLSGPRIDLTNGEANELSFQMWHGFEAEEEDLQLIVYLNYDDKGWEEAARIDYNNGMSGWMRHSVPLASDSNNVQIAFGGYAAERYGDQRDHDRHAEELFHGLQCGDPEHRTDCKLPVRRAEHFPFPSGSFCECE